MMSRSLICILFASVIFLGRPVNSLAQLMPIQTNVTITPPYSVRLTDYASATSNKMQVQLFLKDESPVPVYTKLRVLIELDNNLIIATKKDFVPLRPIQLIGNIPTMVNGADLAPYLDLLNLEFFNDNIKTDYMKSKRLPEGIYTFSVEVYDYYRGLNLSGTPHPTSKHTIQVFLNEVPIWTKPTNNEKLVAQDPQNIFFSWSPRNGSSRNGAFTTEYQFTMVELVPDNIDPNVAIIAATPLYVTTTRSTSLIYDISCPPLVPGRKYACRLKAYDLDNLDLFQNNGYTEVRTFTYGDPCKPPADITAEVATPTSERIKFTTLENYTGISVVYREVSDSTGYSDWYTDVLTPAEITTKEHIIKYLKPGTKYEFQVYATCSVVTSEYSIIQSFLTNKTLPSDTVGNTCGSSGNVPVIAEADKVPISSLSVGDTINIGGFKAQITEITNNGGSFSGKCIVNATTFGIKVISHFTNIKVNPKHQVYEGEIVADWDKSNLIDVDKIINDIKTIADLLKEEYQGFLSLLDDCKTLLRDDPMIIDALEALGLDSVVPPDIKAALNNVTEGNKLITQGEQLIKQGLVDEGEALIAQGHNKMDQGKQTILEKFGIEKDMLTNQLVAFAPAPDQHYGFDSLSIQKAPLTMHYESYIDKNQARISYAWKSLATSNSDKVQVVFKDGSENIIFRTNNNIPITLNGDNTLDLPTGGSAIYVKAFKQLQDVSGNDSLVAVGKLNLVTYPVITPKLYVVALNGNTSSVAGLKERLDKIYAPANVQWDVQSSILNLTVSELNGRDFGAQGTAALSNYTNDMNLVIDSFRTVYPDIDPNAYCIFLVDRGVSDDNRAGFMPLSRKWGFIFTNLAPSTDELLVTIAHELGHGVFRLRHTFSDELGGQAIKPEGTTDNLMDYNGGIALWKNQWDNIHNPAFGLYFFQDEKEGAIVGLVVRYGINVAINIGIQMLTAYLFESDVNSWGQAWDKVSILQALSDGAIDMISVKKYKLILGWANNFILCLANDELGEIDGAKIAQCGLMGLLDLLAGEYIEKYGSAVLKKALQKLGLPEDKISKLLGDINVNTTKIKYSITMEAPTMPDLKLIQRVKKSLLAELDDITLQGQTLKTYVQNNYKELIKQTDVIWDMASWTKRGQVIEELFSLTKYKTLINLNTLRDNFPNVDFDAFRAGLNEVISLKSFHSLTNTTKANFRNNLNKYVKALAEADLSNISVNGGVLNLSNRERVVDFAIKKGYWNHLDINSIKNEIELLYNYKVRIVISEI